jgi:hypothetical protein
MPRLNRVLEQLRIHHEEHSIPPEVLATIEEKKKAAAKNATAAAESKKRKGIGASKVVAKKQKTSTVVVAFAMSIAFSASRSVRVSANAEEFSTENTSGGPIDIAAEAEKADATEDIGGQRAEDMDRSKPSIANPMPSVLGGDSSSSKDVGDAGHGGALPSDDAEVKNGSRRRPADTIVLEVSEDEVESQLPSAF